MSHTDLDDADTVEPGSVSPVFDDPSGRRRRLFRRFAIGVCAVVGLYVVALVAALFGAPIPSSALLPLPAVHEPEAPPQATSTAPAPTTTSVSTSAVTTEGAAPAPHDESSVVVTPAPAAASAPAGTASSESRNTHAPAVPPGKASTGRHP